MGGTDTVGGGTEFSNKTNWSYFGNTWTESVAISEWGKDKII